MVEIGGWNAICHFRLKIIDFQSGDILAGDRWAFIIVLVIDRNVCQLQPPHLDKPGSGKVPFHHRHSLIGVLPR